MKISIKMSIRTKFEMEFLFETTISKLYEYISTDYGLAKWFANKVEVQENENIFRWEWDDIIVHTTLIKKVKNKSMRFRIIENENEEEYFELLIDKNAITDDIALVITDFANADEVDDYKLLWTGQAKELSYLLEDE